MRIPTRTGAWVLEALDANPVGMPVPALPQALSKKVVDGALIPWEIIPPLKIQELTEYQIEGPNSLRFGTTTFQISMNMDSWNRLPADLQKVFEEQSGEAWWREVGEIWTRTEVGGLKVATDAGNEHIVLTDAEVEAFRKKLEPVVDRWIKEVGEKGIDGVALVSAARAAIARHTQ
jgi:TRAP-type C4-dicarboxylate transport system substrate-binding protein